MALMKLKKKKKIENTFKKPNHEQKIVSSTILFYFERLKALLANEKVSDLASYLVLLRALPLEVKHFSSGAYYL